MYLFQLTAQPFTAKQKVQQMSGSCALFTSDVIWPVAARVISHEYRLKIINNKCDQSTMSRWIKILLFFFFVHVWKYAAQRGLNFCPINHKHFSSFSIHTSSVGLPIWLSDKSKKVGMWLAMRGVEDFSRRIQATTRLLEVAHLANKGW